MSWRLVPSKLGSCAACSQQRALRRGPYCRLCWRTAATLHTANRIVDGKYQALDVVAANAHGQQLFLTNQGNKILRRTPQPRELWRASQAIARAPTPQRRRTQLPLWDNRPDSWAQRHEIPRPASQAHATTLEVLAGELATQRGWSDSSRTRLQLGITAVVGWQATPDSPVPASHLDRLTDLGVYCGRMLREVLIQAGLFIDDQPAAIDLWFDRTVAGLPAHLTQEVTSWYAVLRQGSTVAPRSLPRKVGTIRLRVSYAMPALRAWSAAGHTSLREISRDDVLAVLPISGNDRVLAGVALRSLFRTLKGQRVVFSNPTLRIDTGAAERTQPLPADPKLLREALLSPDPCIRAVTALLAFHGLRPGQLRQLQLTDLHDRRIQLGDRIIPLADPVHQRLSSYLDHRAQRWPHSINPHLFINIHTAGYTTAVGDLWITRRLGLSGRQLRDDRILDEVHATGGDIRRICDLFGMSVTAAARYVATLEHPDLRQLPRTGSITAASSRTQP